MNRLFNISEDFLLGFTLRHTAGQIGHIGYVSIKLRIVLKINFKSTPVIHCHNYITTYALLRSKSWKHNPSTNLLGGLKCVGCVYHFVRTLLKLTVRLKNSKSDMRLGVDVGDIGGDICLFHSVTVSDLATVCINKVNNFRQYHIYMILKVRKELCL